LYHPPWTSPEDYGIEKRRDYGTPLRRHAPVGLLVWTVAFIIVLNVLIAQAVVRALYPDAATRLPPAGLAALGALTVICAIYTVRGWRSYLRRPSNE
jgi:hypothetical protein